MSSDSYDIVVIGAGAGGLTAAAFAAELGAKTALVEKARIGGDCTWTGCVPSKALLKAASVAHQVRNAGRYGIRSPSGAVDMPAVREYVRSAIHEVYRHETPELLAEAGIEVVSGPARFTDSQTIAVGEHTLHARNILITTGARARRPDIAGLDTVPFLTYERVFDNDQLPKTMTVIGGGPLGMEIAQAYSRLGSAVTLVARKILPRDEPEARETIRECLEAEGVRFVAEKATSASPEGAGLAIDAGSAHIATDMLVVAAGRVPNVEGLDLERAGVEYSDRGIRVDDRLRTNVRHIYAAGDVVGGPQFTHLAGWQAFQAVRNALLPGSSSGTAGLVPWVTFTDPEVAHVGLTEEDAKERIGDQAQSHFRPMTRVDRAVSDGTSAGFVKLVTGRDNVLLGATVVASRAGELLGELTLAIQKKLSLRDMAGIIHAYPTYSTAIQQLSAEATVARLLDGTRGKVVRTLSKLLR